MSDLERDDKLENIKQEIANYISKECINRETGNQFPSSIILRGMNEINCKVVLNKAAKQQGLGIIQNLKAVLPIERSRMHIKVTFISNEQEESFLKMLQEGYNDQFKVDLERTLDSGSAEAFLTIEKSLYRVVQDTVKKDPQLYERVAVEIQDATTFQAALQFAQSQNTQNMQEAQAAMASMSVEPAKPVAAAAEEEEKKE